MPEGTHYEIGKYGRMRCEYLHEIDIQCYERLELLVEQMKAGTGITEELKATDQMKWVGLMNNVRSSAEEIVLKELIYTGDFRLHGRNRNRLVEYISSLKKIDLLITEGTTLSRDNNENWDEESVTARIRSCTKKYKYCFVITSSSNIDRIQSISEAVPRGKYFLLDDFQKKLLDIA